MKHALAGIRAIDLSVSAAGPFASKMLADLGADVTCISNPSMAEAHRLRDYPLASSLNSHRFSMSRSMRARRGRFSIGASARATAG